MKVWSFYDPVTGFFSGRVYCGSERAMEANTPDGLVAINGEFDHLSQRVEAGEVVDYQPPAPGPDHAWDPEARRYLMTREAAASERRRVDALDRIEELERQQARPQREFALDPENLEARTKLQQIDDEIAQLRLTAASS